MALGPHTPHDLRFATDEALSAAPEVWREWIEAWYQGLRSDDRAFIDGQKQDFVTDCSTPLLRAAAQVWAGSRGAHLPAFLLGLGTVRAAAILRDPDLLADQAPSEIRPWTWMPTLPPGPMAGPEELEERCPRLTGREPLDAWPELAACGDAEAFRLALRGAPRGWSRVQEACAPLGEATETGRIAMPFLLHQLDVGVLEDVSLVVQIGAAVAVAHPESGWRDRVEALARERLEPPLFAEDLADLARLRGNVGLAEALDHVLFDEGLCSCPECGAEQRLGTSPQSHPFAALLEGTPVAGPVRWLVRARCAECGEPLVSTG